MRVSGAMAAGTKGTKKGKKRQNVIKTEGLKVFPRENPRPNAPFCKSSSIKKGTTNDKHGSSSHLQMPECDNPFWGDLRAVKGRGGIRVLIVATSGRKGHFRDL